MEAENPRRSVFNHHDLSRFFIHTKILTNPQVEKLIRCAALYPVDPRSDVSQLRPDWKTLCPELPHKAYNLLTENNFQLYTVKVNIINTTQRGDTTKMLIELQSKKEIETCIMRFGTDNEDSGHRRDEAGRVKFASAFRSTVCVSCQVGCRMACTFCATGTMGLLQNLDAGEILQQIVLANHFERLRGEELGIPSTDGKWIRNVVFMGMGEPLDNYDAVVRAVKCLTHQRMFALAACRVTVSTVGYSPERIRQITVDLPKISLALSLHAPTQKLRNEIVPTSCGTNLDDLLEACFTFVKNQKSLSKTNAKRQVVLFEYCVIADKNDQDEHARQLGALLKDHAELSMINLIPYNATATRANFKTPSMERVAAFANILREEYKLRVFVRQEHGREIAGACGQLAVESKQSTPDPDDDEKAYQSADEVDATGHTDIHSDTSSPNKETAFVNKETAFVNKETAFVENETASQETACACQETACACQETACCSKETAPSGGRQPQVLNLATDKAAETPRDMATREATRDGDMGGDMETRKGDMETRKGDMETGDGDMETGKRETWVSRVSELILGPRDREGMTPVEKELASRERFVRRAGLAVFAVSCVGLLASKVYRQKTICPRRPHRG